MQVVREGHRLPIIRIEWEACRVLVTPGLLSEERALLRIFLLRQGYLSQGSLGAGPTQSWPDLLGTVEDGVGVDDFVVTY